eukprot:5771711-Amphidinium_carterae.1
MRAAAVLCLHAEPQLDIESAVLRPIEQLRMEFATYSKEALAAQVHSKAATLRNFMVMKGFTGCQRTDEDYYRPENSLMHKVLETQCGIPITLSLIYMTLAPVVGLQLRGQLLLVQARS